MTELPTFQLEIFDGKHYTPHMRASDRRASESLAELGRTIGKPWRVVRPEKAWPSKPRYRTPTGPRTSGRSADSICREYLDWAQRAGLETVTVYRGSLWEHMQCAWKVRVVDVADFLGDPPAAEMED